MEWFWLLERALNRFVWGPATLALLLGTGIFLSVRTGFPQLRQLRRILKHTAGGLFRRRETENGENLSPFQAMSTALAGCVGTGNIAGVAGAILTGGPGAVFWMWVSAFFGMCTKLVEIALALRYRETRGGVYRGGPMYYIEKGLGRRFRWLAAVFAVSGGLASFGIGNLAQSSEIAGAMSDLFRVPPRVTGLVLAAVTAAVVFGGVRRVGRVTEILVPLMSGAYLLVGLAVVVLHAKALPAAFASIFRGAFRLRAMGGGVFGAALRVGLARGVFSNEAGLGSAPIAHAASACAEPCEEAMWGVFEVLIDTFAICTLTALAVLLSGVTEAFPSPGGAAEAAFSAVLPGRSGGAAVRLCLLLFALSTIFGWSCYGARCWGWLTRESPAADALYKLLFSLACYAGATGSGERLWEVSDTLNGLMILPNLTALLLLSGEAAGLLRGYFANADGTCCKR